MTFYTIPPTVPFADRLAAYCEEVTQGQEISLSEMTVYLPTRRSIRTLQEAFLRRSCGQARVLPIIRSIGDVDLEEVSFTDVMCDDLLPAISPLRRQCVLAQFIQKAFSQEYTYQQALDLAKELGHLIDQIHTQGLSLDSLSEIVNVKELAQYWEITVSFLSLILGNLWPNYLEQEGFIDPGLHRRLRIETLSRFYRQQPPKKPIIVAASTGSISATRDFIKTIHDCEQGHVILPALDTVMDDRTWFALGDGHPQFLLKTLLSFCKVDRTTVKSLAEPQNLERFSLMSEMMRPAVTTETWSELERNIVEKGLSGITLRHADNDQHEAGIIALAMAEIAHDPDQQKTATLVTPDRLLAMRVKSLLKQWEIDIDDSAGTSLSTTSLGQFCLYVLKSVSQGIIDPISLLSCLKNTYAGDGNSGLGENDTLRSYTRLLEKKAFRGLCKRGLFEDIQADDETLSGFVSHLGEIFSPLTDLLGASYNVSTLVRAHVMVMESLAKTSEKTGADRLWIGEAGESLAQFLTQLQLQNDVIPPMTVPQYMEVLEVFLSSITFTARYGKHPRLSILGQIESRMLQADRVILSGLNEGIWPPDSGFDAWMSRPMRERFGLPSLEQKTTLAAHDFATAFCAKDVFITRSQKSNGQPTLPSRWIERLHTVLQAVDCPKEKWPDAAGNKYEIWAQELRMVETVTPALRPSPKPSAQYRPKNFSVTEIEKWMRDPYWIYAKKVLNLRQLDPIDRDLSAADRGNLIHAVMEKFTKQYDTPTLPQNMVGHLLSIGREFFETYKEYAQVQGLWWPRFEKTVNWLTSFEKDWRQGINKIHAEMTCSISFNFSGETYTLQGKCDRIEDRANHSIAIIDYKTGGIPSASDVVAGLASQLPLEAVIIEQDGMASLKAIGNADYSFFYWNLGGTGEGGQALSALGNKKVTSQEMVSQAYEGVSTLIEEFSNENTPYIATPDQSIMLKTEHNDYAHLERISEWSVVDNEGGE